jgi:phage terminase large subunit-like protein
VVAWNPERRAPGLPPNTDTVTTRTVRESFRPVEIKPDPFGGPCRLFYFDPERADRPVEFIERFVRHVKGKLAGRLFKLEPWQRTAIREVFGWVDAKTGLRRYSTFFLFLPRKNGKSLFAAALSIYMMCADGEFGAEVYFAACDKDQAKLSFDVARGIVAQSEFLSSNLIPKTTAIVHEPSVSVLRPLSGDVTNKDGKNVHCGVIDELHEHKDRRLFDVLVTGTGAREQPLTVITTTAGVKKNGICYDQYETATRVLAGESEDYSFYPCVFQADEGDDFRDPETWRKANPNLGVSISEDFLAKECQKAIEQPSFESAFRRYYLNQWVGSVARWIPSLAWEACTGSPGVSIEDMAGREGYLAFDMSSTQDITALVGVFPRDADPDDPNDAATLDRLREVSSLYEDDEADGDVIGDGRVFDVVCSFWVPAESAEVRARRDKVPYPRWIKEGWIYKTAGGAMNPASLRREINRWASIADVREIAADPWNALETIQNLEDQGYEALQMRQGVTTLNAPSKAFIRAVVSHQLRHHGNPVLSWMADNVVAEEAEGGLIKPSKKKSPERIDGIVSLIMGLSRAMLRRRAPVSVYESRGLRGDDTSTDAAQPG